MIPFGHLIRAEPLSALSNALVVGMELGRLFFLPPIRFGFIRFPLFWCEAYAPGCRIRSGSSPPPFFRGLLDFGFESFVLVFQLLYFGGSLVSSPLGSLLHGLCLVCYQDGSSFFP